MNIDKLKNEYWFNVFLFCNKLAVDVCKTHGWHVKNMAKLINEEQNGVIGNNQMTCYFKTFSEFFISEFDVDDIFEILENDLDITLDELANIDEEYLDFSIEDFKLRIVANSFH